MQSSVSKILLDKNLIDEKKLKKAWELSEKHSDKMEDVLLKNEMVTGEDLYRTVAERYGFQYVDIKKHVCDHSLLKEEDMFFYIRNNFIPWRSMGEVVSVAVVEMSDKLFLYLKSRYPHGFRVVYATPKGILVNIQRKFSEVAMDITKKELTLINPKASSKKVLTGVQKIWISLIVSVFLYASYLYPVRVIQSVFVGGNILFFFNILFKAFIFCRGNTDTKERVRYNVSNKDLPVYSIIIPLYKEGNVLKKLFKSIRNLQYPKSKLDVILAVEQFDRETIGFLNREDKEGLFRVVCVPSGYPKTKPKACSYALKFAKGEFVTIYDAEDRPEKNQLLKSVNIFRKNDESLACIQASLKCINFQESLLAFLFSIEYSVLFEFFLKGLESIGSPIPLGGTSNHFRVDILKRVGGWDPYNVTEDADLGYRLFKSGYKVRVFDSTTREELPSKLGPWIKQRSRWIKGHMQTYIVHLRDRSKFRKEAGIPGVVGFHAFIIMPIICYFLQGFVVFSLFLSEGIIGKSMISFSVFNLALWIVISIIFGIIAIRRNNLVLQRGKHKKRSMLKVVFFPFYYLLHSISAIIALYELVFKTHHWSKTTHDFDQRREYKMEKEK